MVEKPVSMHDQWIEILKYILVFVFPTMAAIWQVTNKWAEVQKQRLSESLKEAVKEVVNPKFEAMERRMDVMTEQIGRNKETSDKQYVDLIREIKK